MIDEFNLRIKLWPNNESRLKFGSLKYPIQGIW